MRINHNIPALNTYRSVVANNASTSKSLERLSSGLRINRAGDDAAGLAISEKMRGQIRGLNQAERNAQDGISMLQTAEGALSEVHSILQRIKELATQAASDTNVKVDRDEIQKEINQLTSEINRIGNTTEFNTQKLLDGGTVKSAVTTQTKGLAVTQGAATAATNTASVKAIGFLAEVGTGSTKAVAAEYSMEVTTGRTININAGETNGAAANALKIEFGALGGTGAATANFSAATNTVTINLSQTAANNTAAAIEGLLQGLNLTSLGITAGDIEVTLDGGGDLGVVTDAGSILDPAEAATALSGGVTEVRGVYSFELTEDFLATLEADDTITIAGQTFTAKAAGADAANQEFDIAAGDTETTLANILAAVQDAAAALHGAGNRFDATAAGNVLTLTERAGEATGGDLDDATIEVEQTAGDYTLEITKLFKAGEQITFGGQTFKAVASGAAAANGQFLAGTTIESQTESLKAAIEATLGGRFTVTLDNNTLNLVEKPMQATGEDLAVTKTGNVQGNLSFKNTAQGSLGTAAVWDSGAITALAADGDGNGSGTFTFNGVTVNLSIAAAGDPLIGAAPAVDAANKSVSVTIVNTSDDAATATAIQQALDAYRTGAGDGNELADFEFAVDDAGTGITITGVTDAATGIAKNGDDYNNLVIGGTIQIGNTTNLAQLTTHGADSRKATYTLDITASFKVNEAIEIAGRQFIGVEGVANALLGEFSISGSKADQAESLRAAIDATPTLSNRYDVAVSGSKITLTEKVAGQEGEALAAPTTELTKGTAGVYSFKAQVVNAGQAYKIDGVSISVVNDAEKYREEIAAGTAILAAASASEQAENLRAAINVNEALSAKYIAEGTGDTVRLTQQEGAESAADPSITIENQGADGKFVANFQIGANTGQSMTIEMGDVRSVALKISGTEAGTSITAKNGVEASYVTAANVSNGTDNTSVEYSLDVSSHTKASAAVSVIQDAIDSVSAQRSQMGAYQNRLEHTINNLGTSAENLTAAESRIRDVDMAKEMMEFTKNNILAQAAQAMLAQANQQPQAVLQLLQ